MPDSDAGRIRRLGLPDQFIEHGDRSELLAELGFNAQGIAQVCREMAKARAAVAADRPSPIPLVHNCASG